MRRMAFDSDKEDEEEKEEETKQSKKSKREEKKIKKHLLWYPLGFDDFYDRGGDVC